MPNDRATRSKTALSKTLREQVERNFLGSNNPFTPSSQLNRSDDNLAASNVTDSSSSQNDTIVNPYASNFEHVQSESNLLISNQPATSSPHNSKANLRDLFDNDTSDIFPTDNAQRELLHDNIPVICKEEIMATISLKEALEIVPIFDGKNITAREFLKGVREAKELYGAAGEAILIKMVRNTKLQGQAKKVFEGVEAATLNAFEAAVKNIYIGVTNITDLRLKLANEDQLEDESVLDFFGRINEISNMIIDTKLAEGAITPEFRAEIKNEVKRCFRKGLNPEIEIRLGADADFEELSNKAITIEKEIEEKRQRLRRKTTGEKYHTKNNNRRTMHNEMEETDELQRHAFLNETSNDKEECQICNKLGHHATKCKTYLDTLSPEPTCQLCNKTGHKANKCFKLIKCNKCNKYGHMPEYCKKNNLRISNSDPQRRYNDNNIHRQYNNKNNNYDNNNRPYNNNNRNNNNNYNNSNRPRNDYDQRNKNNNYQQRNYGSPNQGNEQGVAPPSAAQQTPQQTMRSRINSSLTQARTETNF